MNCFFPWRVVITLHWFIVSLYYFCLSTVYEIKNYWGSCKCMFIWKVWVHHNTSRKAMWGCWQHYSKLKNEQFRLMHEKPRIVFIKRSHGYGLWFWSHKIMCLDSFFCLFVVDENKRELCWIFNYGRIAIYMCLNSSLFSRVLDVAGFQSYPSYDIGKKNPPVFNFFFVILSPSIDVITEWLEFKGLFADIFQNSSQKIIFIF